MICIHTGQKNSASFFHSGVGPVRMPVRWCPAGRGAVIVRYGCRRFIYACATLNRNAENVHAGIDWESFPKHSVESKKICVMPACWLPFLEKILPRDERMGAPSLLRSGEGHAARQGRERPGSGAGRARALGSGGHRKKDRRQGEGMPGQGKRGGQKADGAGGSR